MKGIVLCVIFILAAACHISCAPVANRKKIESSPKTDSSQSKRSEDPSATDEKKDPEIHILYITNQSRNESSPNNSSSQSKLSTKDYSITSEDKTSDLQSKASENSHSELVFDSPKDSASELKPESTEEKATDLKSDADNYNAADSDSNSSETDNNSSSDVDDDSSKESASELKPNSSKDSASELKPDSATDKATDLKADLDSTKSRNHNDTDKLNGVSPKKNASKSNNFQDSLTTKNAASHSAPDTTDQAGLKDSTSLNSSQHPNISKPNNSFSSESKADNNLPDTKSNNGPSQSKSNNSSSPSKANFSLQDNPTQGLEPDSHASDSKGTSTYHIVCIKVEKGSKRCSEKNDASQADSHVTNTKASKPCCKRCNKKKRSKTKKASKRDVHFGNCCECPSQHQRECCDHLETKPPCPPEPEVETGEFETIGGLVGAILDAKAECRYRCDPTHLFAPYPVPRIPSAISNGHTSATNQENLARHKLLGLTIPCLQPCEEEKKQSAEHVPSCDIQCCNGNLCMGLPFPDAQMDANQTCGRLLSRPKTKHLCGELPSDKNNLCGELYKNNLHWMN